MVNEANTAISKTTLYISEKETEGYILTGAKELLTSAQALYDSQQYLEAKNNADDALIIAQDTVDFADTANNAISSAEDMIQGAYSEGRTEGIDVAESFLLDAQSLFDEGSYRNAEIVALQAEEAVNLSVKPRDNSLMYGSIIVLGLIIAVLALRRRVQI